LIHEKDIPCNYAGSIICYFFILVLLIPLEWLPVAQSPLFQSLVRHTFLFKKKKPYKMNWIQLTNLNQLEEIKEKSKQKPQVIFKHSTRCSISSMARGRLERSTAPNDADFYYLDLITYRDISNKIAEDFHVYHESPQIIVIKNGKCVYDESHGSITMDEIKEQVMV
jgi:bacillithiol system protein YtxJ